MLFEQLLVPLDGTAEPAVALPMARAMARAAGATFTLLRVVTAAADERALREAQRELDGIAAELTTDGFVAKTVVRTGDPAEEIVVQARADATDVIVMRTHGRAGLARAVLGSVAERALAASPVPLLLVRADGQYVSQIKAVLVPVDGSPGGALALGAAVGLAKATGASLRLLEVVVPIPTYIYGAYAVNGAAFVDPAWDEEARVSAQTYVDGLAARLRSSGLAVDTEVCIAPSVADAIGDIAEARGVDLIVMSTQALNGAARAIVGSVADAVVRVMPGSAAASHVAAGAADRQRDGRPAFGRARPGGGHGHLKETTESIGGVDYDWCIRCSSRLASVGPHSRRRWTSQLESSIRRNLSRHARERVRWIDCRQRRAAVRYRTHTRLADRLDHSGVVRRRVGTQPVTVAPNS